MRGRVCFVAPPVHRRTGRQHAGIRGGLAGLQMGKEYYISSGDLDLTCPITLVFESTRNNHTSAKLCSGTGDWGQGRGRGPLTCIGRLFAMVKLGMGGSAL